QPQALIVINDIISRGGHIDVLIELDGFNEIALPEAHGNVAQGISPFFPQNWRAIAEGELSPDQLEALSESRLIEDVRYRWAAWFANQLLKRSIFANLLWRVVDVQLLNYDLFYRSRASQSQPSLDPSSRVTNDKRAFLGPAVHYKSRRDLYISIAQ